MPYMPYMPYSVPTTTCGTTATVFDASWQITTEDVTVGTMVRPEWIQVYANAKWDAMAKWQVIAATKYPCQTASNSITTKCCTCGCDDDGWARAETAYMRAWVQTYCDGVCRQYELPQKTPQERLQEMLRLRQAPSIIVPSRRPLVATTDPRELNARQTLRTLIGEQEYRLFLKNGFVTIRGKSGRFYQIYPGHNFTKVYENGKVIEELCVVLKSGQYCPTDSILMRYVMLLNDEMHFRGLANIHRARPLAGLQVKPVDSRPLIEIFASLKSGRAAA